MLIAEELEVDLASPTHQRTPNRSKTSALLPVFLPKTGSFSMGRTLVVRHKNKEQVAVSYSTV
jgi:hypothetical protein